jgi:two-component system chemotaxis response regulator CheY
MMKVLVVDDDDAIGEFVDWVLTDEGHEVTKAGNGAIALKLLEGLAPDVILLDMRMPVMDGWQFADAYRKGNYPRVPIVVVTAARDATERADEIGADAYLGKPFDIDDLLATVRRFATVD